MIRPVIGITTYGRNDENRFHLQATYVESVRRAGGYAVLLPPGDPDIGGLLARLDGLILAGGGDIDPARYGGQQHETIDRVDPERDEMEIALARQLVDSGQPALCICRGTQVLNVALGGTLIEDLPSMVGEQVLHRAQPPGTVYHDVAVEAGSQLAAVMGQTTVTPASWHHQALRQVAPGLKVVAHASDGTIEAVEMPGHPGLLGVQWHPERSAATDATQQRLFDHLVESARQRVLSSVNS